MIDIVYIERTSLFNIIVCKGLSVYDGNKLSLDATSPTLYEAEGHRCRPNYAIGNNSFTLVRYLWMDLTADTIVIARVTPLVPTAY